LYNLFFEKVRAGAFTFDTFCPCWFIAASESRYATAAQVWSWDGDC
jgi:hypothetical protein